MNSADLSALNGAKCRIFGLGRANEALISYLHKEGADISVSDKRKSENEIEEILERNGIRNACVLPYNQLRKADFVFRTPGMRPDAKEITDNLALGATLTSETELFFERAEGTIYGITGSDGKTTTASIAYELLKRQSPNNTYVGGNIGTPLVSILDKLGSNSVTVCELSSFQLMTMKTSPDYSVITNLTENHLDYHTDMREYIAAKSRIYAYSRCKKLVIDGKTADFFNKPFPINTIFSNQRDICLQKGHICYFGQPLLDVADIAVKGSFNILNYMSAVGLTYPMVTAEDIASVAKAFKGVPHRMELVAEKNKVKYYNCSIDSTPSRTLATLSCFEGEGVTLILGGYDKNLDYTMLSQNALKSTDKFVLCGANRYKIYNSLVTNGVPLKKIIICSEFDAAVYAAAELTRPGKSVLLSPASASFDSFGNFEERGNRFKNIINNL